MKKIAFVLYTYQMLSITYVNGLPTTKKLEEALRKILENEYEVTFEWEEAAKDKTVDALVIPRRFPPILNDNHLPEIKIPGSYFYLNDVEKIKEEIDAYFEMKE